MQHERDGHPMNGLVPIPGQLDRFVRLAVDGADPPSDRFVAHRDR